MIQRHDCRSGKEGRYGMSVSRLEGESSNEETDGTGSRAELDLSVADSSTGMSWGRARAGVGSRWGGAGRARVRGLRSGARGGLRAGGVGWAGAGSGSGAFTAGGASWSSGGSGTGGVEVRLDAALLASGVGNSTLVGRTFGSTASGVLSVLVGWARNLEADGLAADVLLGA